MSWFHSALHPSCYELGFPSKPLTVIIFIIQLSSMMTPAPRSRIAPAREDHVLVVSTPLKNMLVKMGSSSPIFGMKTKKLSCHLIIIYHLGFPGVFFCRHVPKKNGSPGCKKTEVPRHSSTVRRKSPTCWYLEPNGICWEDTQSQKVPEKMGDVCLAGKHKKKQLIWVFPKIVGFPPKSSILIGFSIINHPFCIGYHYFWKHPYVVYPINYEVLHIPGGAGFLKHQQYSPLYWLRNRDPYFMVYYTPHMTG